jgi:hypothetical protein
VVLCCVVRCYQLFRWFWCSLVNFYPWIWRQKVPLKQLLWLPGYMEEEVALRLIVSMPWYRAPLWDLRPDITSCRNVAVWNLRSCFCGRPLWREDGSAICSVITQWSESRRTRNGPSCAEPVTILYCLIRDSSNLEGQVPVFISSRNRVTFETIVFVVIAMRSS